MTYRGKEEARGEREGLGVVARSVKLVMRFGGNICLNNKHINTHELRMNQHESRMSHA